MSKISYSIRPSLIGFSDESVEGLNTLLNKKGYEYQQPQLGGGSVPEVITQVVVWLNYNSFLASVFLIVATSVTKKIYTEVKKWYKKNPPKYKKNQRVKNYIHISFGGRKRCFDFELDLSREYSNQELKAIVKNSREKNK